MPRPVAIASLVAVVASAAPPRALAGGVVEEISAGTTPAPGGAASSSWLTDRLAAIWDPDDAWQLRLDAAGTRYLHATADDLAVLELSVEYDPDAHWSLRLAAGGSPSSTSSSTLAVRAQGALGRAIAADATIASTASSRSASAAIGYDTAGDGDLEASLTVGATVLALATQDEVRAVAGRGGQAITLDELRAACAAHPCTGGLGAALDGVAGRLTQLAVTAGVTAQLYADTDVGVDGAFTFYDQDPTQLGASSISRAGQTASGGGIGIAPVRYGVTPSLAHRFGPVTALASVAYRKYVDDLGYALDAALRLQWKLTLDGDRRLKLWAKLTGARDVDQMSAASKAGSIALGVQYTW